MNVSQHHRLKDIKWAATKNTDKGPVVIDMDSSDHLYKYRKKPETSGKASRGSLLKVCSCFMSTAFVLLMMQFFTGFLLLAKTEIQIDEKFQVDKRPSIRWSLLNDCTTDLLNCHLSNVVFQAQTILFFSEYSINPGKKPIHEELKRHLGKFGFSYQIVQGRNKTEQFLSSFSRPLVQTVGNILGPNFPQDLSLFRCFMTVISGMHYTESLSSSTNSFWLLEAYDDTFGKAVTSLGLDYLESSDFSGQTLMIRHLGFIGFDSINYESLSKYPYHLWQYTGIVDTLGTIRKAIAAQSPQPPSESANERDILFIGKETLLYHYSVKIMLALEDIDTSHKYRYKLSEPTVSTLEIIERVQSSDVIICTSDELLLVVILFAKDTSLIVQLSPASFFYWNFARMMNLKFIMHDTARLPTIYGNLNGMQDNAINMADYHSYNDFERLNNGRDYAIGEINCDQLAETIVHGVNEFPATNYLLYMPWEQLNNQLIELKCACELALKLDRVLVIPYIGYRKEADNGWDFTFQIAEFNWTPLDSYFQDTLLTLPCKTISTLNFKSLFYSHHRLTAAIQNDTLPALAQQGKTIGPMFHNPFAKATKKNQLEDYFFGLQQLPYSSVETLPRLYQLNDTEIAIFFEPMAKQSVVAIGCTFWIAGFGKYQPYPLKEYANYMDVDSYKSIVWGMYRAIRGRNDLDKPVGKLVRTVIESVRLTVSIQQVRQKPKLELSSGDPLERHGRFIDAEQEEDDDNTPLPPIIKEIATPRWVGVHIRKGDYWNKCRGIKDKAMQNMCFPPMKIVNKRVFKWAQRWADEVVSTSSRRMENVILYVSTNANFQEKLEISEFDSKYRVIYMDTLHTLLPLEKQAEVRLALESLDPIEKAFVDMLICAMCDQFFGNIYSSFSRTIMEMRELEDRPFGSF